MREISEAMARMKGRWMIGGSALDQAPQPWRALLADDPEADLALLALSCQARQIALRPDPGGALTPARPIPHLALPPLPDALRPRFRRLIEIVKPSPDDMAAIATLMAGRGHVSHPADWMPRTAHDRLPGLYAPWCDWHAAETQGPAQDALTDETWHAWGPAERRIALETIRRDDPARARALIEANAGQEPAEQRLRLVQVLEIGLGESDMAYLEGLSSDRSTKIRTLAERLLSRLGRIGDEDMLARELAGFLAKGRAVLGLGRVHVTPARLRTNAQKARRADLFGTVSLAGLASALEMPAEALPNAWAFKDDACDHGLTMMVAQTGSAEAVALLVERLIGRTGGAAAIVPLLARLDDAARRALLPRMIAIDEADLTSSTTCASACLGTATLDTLAGAPAVRGLLERAAKTAADGATDALLVRGLFHLGLLADASAASALTQRFVTAGMIAADPALTLLTFNAAFHESPSP